MYNLLLVDDEPLIKVAFQSAVEWGKNGFLLAATASNGQEALHIVETQHIDAVITDLKMPGMDGLALIHELKKAQLYRSDSGIEQLFRFRFRAHGSDGRCL